jgi:hypothetical protein
MTRHFSGPADHLEDVVQLILPAEWTTSVARFRSNSVASKSRVARVRLPEIIWKCQAGA